MRLFKKMFFMLVLPGVFVSCSNSIDSDAKEAHSLVLKSMEATRKYNLKDAAKYYGQYKEIKEKYQNTSDYALFEEAYKKYETEY